MESMASVDRRENWAAVQVHPTPATKYRRMPEHLSFVGCRLGAWNGRMPVLVHITLVYIRKQLQKMRRLLQSALSAHAEPKQSFRTDAKCAEGHVVLGGWDLTAGNDPWKAVV